MILHFWKPYEIYDAFYDAMAICGCFIGVLFVIYMFRMQNPDSLLEGILTKRDFKMSKSKAMSVRFKDVAGME